jgi:hypothetical protein
MLHAVSQETKCGPSQITPAIEEGRKMLDDRLSCSKVRRKM